MYGLVKIHKNGYPLRPIVSSVGTFNYNLSKFLISFLNPFASNQYSLQNTADFISQISLQSFSFPIVMASFDVVSLFTNVPLKETNKIAIDKLYDSNYPKPFEKSIFTKLLDIASSHSVFLFNSTLYKQIDGCSMGGPLSPTLANLFMCHNESIWLQNCPAHFKPLFYRRYVDDCFLLFRDSSHVNLFLEYLNNQHPNIKFTSEIEVNHVLNFLDASIYFTGSNFKTSVYRKDSFTGLGLNFFSFLPISYKINSIKTLFNRAYNICSSYESLHNEIVKLTDYFVSNSYPLKLIESTFFECLNKSRQPNLKQSTVPKLVKYIKLPYYGPISFEIRRNINKILKFKLNHVDFRIVFSNPCTIGSFFKIKDSTPCDVQSRVVYEYKCSSCNAGYIGSTSRSFKARRLGHMGRSIHTGRPLGKPEHSNIRLHSEAEDHPVNHSDFKILHSLPDNVSLLIAESLYIGFNKPSLNNNVSSTELFTVHM